MKKRGISEFKVYGIGIALIEGMKRFILTIIFTLNALFAPFLVLNGFSKATLPYESVAQARQDSPTIAECTMKYEAHAYFLSSHKL